MNPLLAFYYGAYPDHRGRFLAEITEQDDLWLEVTHDYIQWLFPLREASRVVPSAPLATKEVVKAFQDDELLRSHLMASFLRMLSFYGLIRRGNVIVKGPNWAERKVNWFTEGTHNDLRITRILKCLSVLGLGEEAKKLLTCLEGLRRDEPDCGISDTAFGYWRKALHEDG